ncbi:hypothetical protein ERJ70_18640 [Sediminibacillus dalangtanensis]|uniref:Lipoprotein n=1 Tax=Sediminibacillus dalangtanensis TaxID=2729421 RepID=A0ABX7VZ37_9BACI|nr:hypothetical protein [Sediminibacillus dalangtanensis]QTN01126.1 hypothetical protein ERJ70_18640 [Sediminibacillus dalangtanensis]
MKKLVLLFAGVLLVSFLVACSENTYTNDNKEENKEDKQSEESASEDKKQENKETEEKQEEQEKEETKPPQPYKPLEPAEDAEPLKDKLSEEELEKMPKAEAHGDDRTRMVPVGETLVKGAEDQTDGPLKNHRLVAYYGHPNSTNMGILGEMEPDELMEKLKEQAQEYSDANPSRPAIPTIELISTVAQRDPGPEGKYFHRTSPEQIDEYAELAKENDALLMLDVQLGTDSVLNQVKLLEKWLKLPYVHLAIDTEFHVKEGETPGIDLGQVNGEEVQEAVNYLTEMVEENDLPDKIVLVHQFMDEALTNKDAIQPTENVEVALNYDGWGASSTKMSLYRKFVRNEAVQYGGFKVFYQKDEPVLSAEDVLKLDPNPAIVNYQ